MRIPTRRVYFVPPSESYEAPSSNVFEIVKIRGEKEDGEDEDEDARFLKNQKCWFITAVKGHVGGGGGEVEVMIPYKF